MSKVYQNQKLRIDKDIIEKASSLKIDIPTITEELLKNDKYNEDYTKENVLQLYKKMFNKCRILLQKYQLRPSTKFEVGEKDIGEGEEGLKIGNIYFNDYGHFFSESEDMSVRCYELEEILFDLHSTQQILTNLYLKLIQLAELNKKLIKQLELVYIY